MTFSEERFEAAEADGAVEICVNLTTTGQLRTAVEIQLSAVGNSAVAGSDFLSVPRLLSFLEGGTMCASVSLLADGALETEELFEAVITSDSAFTVNILTPSVDVIIVDSDRTFKLWSFSNVV